MAEITLNQSHISHLDKVIAFIISNPKRRVYEDYDFAELQIDHDISEDRSMFYCKVLEQFGLIYESTTRHCYLINNEEIRIFQDNGGFAEYVRKQSAEIAASKTRNHKLAELTDLQIRQVKVEIKKTIKELWWFWIAASIALIDLLMNLLKYFKVL